MARDPDIILSAPVTGIITQRFGENPQMYQKFGQPGHTGIDYGVPMGTKVNAMADGVVEKIAEDPDGYGKYVKIRHTATRGWYWTLYAHLSQNNLLAVGLPVKQGQAVGFSGSTGNSTGPHLHAELQIPWDQWPGYKYYVANIDQYLSNTVANPFNPPGTVLPGSQGSIPGGSGAQVKPGTAVINADMVNIRPSPSLGSVPIAMAREGMVFDYAGEYCEAEGRKWRVIHLYVADELIDEHRPLTVATDVRVVPGPR